MLPLLQRLRDSWPLLALGALAVVSFFAGRYSAPTKTVTQTVDKVAYQDRVVEKRVEVQAEAKTQERVVYRDRTVITRADGTSIRRDVERTDTGRASESVTAASQEHAETQVVYRDREVTRTVETARPRFQAGLLAGAQPLHLAEPISMGGEVQVRVVGPVWLGAWGLSSGVGGVCAALEF